jgi:hypothetical protein
MTVRRRAEGSGERTTNGERQGDATTRYNMGSGLFIGFCMHAAWIFKGMGRW